MHISLRHSIKHYLNAYVPVVLWSLFIYVLSSQPVLPGPELFTWDYLFKKCAHMFVYFVLFFLFHRAMKLHIINYNHRSYIAFVFTILYAMTDEFHQSFVPGRYGTLRDLGYDALGAFVGWLRLHKYI